MNNRKTSMNLVGLLAAITVILAACSDSTQFPEPTGKGTFRAINAISTSPPIVFRLEEIGGDNITFRTATKSVSIDDFAYNFNFEVSYPGEIGTRRVKTVTQKIDANMDYTFVATGAVSDPTIITWVASERDLEEGATVSQIRLAHLAESVGEVDVYFSVEGTSPVLGEQRGTYRFGDILDPIDVQEANYVLTATEPGDPSIVIYQSNLTGFVAGAELIVAIFDGTADDTSPVVGRALEAGAGGSFTLADARFDSTIRFIQGSEFVDTTDIYDDEALTNRIVAGLPYAGFSDELDVIPGIPTFRFTPANSTETILLEQDVAINQGRRYDFYVIGDSETVIGLNTVSTRQPVEIYASVAVTNTLIDEERQILNVYLLAPGETVEDRLLPDFATLSGIVGGNFPLVAGSYDLVITRSGETTPLAEAIPLTLADGDVERFVIFATPDPNVIDIRAEP